MAKDMYVYIVLVYVYLAFTTKFTIGRFVNFTFVAFWVLMWFTFELMVKTLHMAITFFRMTL